MPSPANDNWSNAIVLTDGDFTITPILGDNIGATAESGEPTNNGKTVWYSWTPSGADRVQVFGTAATTTNRAAFTNPPDPVLTTVLRIYTCPSGTPAVNNLSEITYLSRSFNQRYGNYDLGSLVIFKAVAGTAYYIRIDGAHSTGVSAIASIINGGSGYNIGDTIYPQGGSGQNAVLTVTSVSSGAITGLSITTPGSYSALPYSPSPMLTITGTGSGAVVSLTFGTVTLEGNFGLWWDIYFPQLEYGCSNCPPVLAGCGYTCVGVLTPDVTLAKSPSTYFSNSGCTFTNTPNTTPLLGQPYSFGSSLPAGPYIIRYCTGAYNTDVGTANPWTILFNNVCGDDGEAYVIEWNDVSSGTRKKALFLPSDFQNQSNSQLGAEQFVYGKMLSELCGFQLNHSGGDITIYLIDPIFTDNANGSPDPTFGLYSVQGAIADIDPAQSFACASWVTTGVSATCTFSIYNAGTYSTNNTVTLQNTGGVSGASSPQTGVNLAPGLNTLTFTFNCTSSDITATLEFATSCGTQLLSMYIGPVIQVVSVPTGSFFVRVVGGTCYDASALGSNQVIQIKNIGYWNISATIVFSVTAPTLLASTSGASCPGVSSNTYTGRLMACQSSAIRLFNVVNNEYDFTTDGTAQTTTCTLQVSEAGRVILTDVYSLSIPHA